jgi:hypothetical protein
MVDAYERDPTRSRRATAITPASKQRTDQTRASSYTDPIDIRPFDVGPIESRRHHPREVLHMSPGGQFWNNPSIGSVVNLACNNVA